MAITLTVSNLVRNNIGNKRLHEATITPAGTYLTNGFSFSPSDVGLHAFDNGGVRINSPSGYTMNYDSSTGKVLVYVTGSVTPAGTNSKPTFTVEASGSIGTNMEVGLSADSAAATFEGGTGITAQRVLTTTSPVGTPTFTGSATTAAALAELANGTSFTTAFNVSCVGI